MPSAVFQADFTKWDKALADAKGGLKSFEVSAKGVQAQLQKTANSFAGTNIQKQANIAVAAVQAIGGVTKLTDSEQKKLNATVTEAIAKYKALGQQAPADMVAIANATKQSSSALEGIGKQALAFAAGFATFDTAKSIVVGGLRAIVGVVEDSIESFANAESAQKHLTAALSTQGTGTEKVIGDYNALATTFQRTTVYSDDLINEMQALLVQVGNVMPSEMDGALKAATDLASGLGIDLHDATIAVAKGFDGNITSLRKYGVQVDEAAFKTDGANAVLKAIEARFGGQAQAELETYTGRLKEMANAWDNVKEEIGRTIVLNPTVELGLRKISEAMHSTEDAAGDTAVSFASVANAFGASPFTVAGIALVEQYADSLNDVDHALNRLKPPAPDLFQPQTLNGPNAQAGLDVWDDLVKKEEAAKKVAEEHAKAIRQLQDDLSGASALRSLNDLQAAWNSLTPAEQANAVAVGDVQKKYADLAAKLPELPPSLRSFAASMDAAQKASEPFTAGLDAAETAMHDLLEEASKLAAADLSKFTSAINDLSGQSGLEKAVYDFDALNAAIEQGGATAEGTKKVYDEVGAAINAILSGGARLTGSLEEQTAQWDKLTQAAADFSALHPIEPTDEALPKVIVKTEDWTKDIGELSHALADLAQISGGTFGKIFQSLSSIVGATNAAIKSIDGIGSAMDAIHKADGTKDLAKGFLSLTTSILGAVSAAIAFGEALVKAFKKDRAKEEVGSIAKEFGETVSKEFGQQIEDLAKNQFGGNRQAAKIFDLDQIISQGGGITAKNLGVLEDRLHDVFSLLQTGALSGDQAMQVLDKNFQTFVDYLGGNVDPALKNIIKLNDEFGTHSKAIAQYVDAQANTALSSLSKVVSARQSALDALNNAKTPDDRKKAQAQLDALPLTKNSGAAFGGALFGIFERLQKDGVSAIDTLKQIDPVIESLDKQFAQAGISGGAAFDKIKSLAGIATDEIAGPSFEAIQNYGAALTALNNANILDQETFTGLSEQITATYQAAVDALTKEGKDGSAALGLVAPDLQKIWELQQDFGYAVDDSTQALLDQAVAAGDVGEKHRSVQAQTLDVMKHLDAVLSGIGQKFGVDIPSDIDKTGAAFDGLGTKIGDAVDKIPDKINIPIDFKIPDNYQPPDHWTGPDGQEHPIFYAKGGPVYAAGGMFIPKGTDTVPAMLTPGEGVLSLNGMRNLGALNNGGTISGSAPTQTVVILQIDKREIGRAIADVLPGEVRRLGVRVRT